MKKQRDYKRELIDALHEAGAKIIGCNDDKWIIHFEVNSIPFCVMYDDGIDCYRYGRPFYTPLKWGEHYLDVLVTMLIATKN